MKILNGFLLIIPILTFSQEIIKCKDSTNFILNKIDNEYLSIKIKGNIDKTENPKVLVLNDNIIIQTLINKKKQYNENGDDEITILATYVLNEGNYFSSIFKKKVDLAIFPVDLEYSKKAIFWHFDLPKNKSKNDIEATKSVFISIVKNDHIYTIGTTLFQNQKLEKLEKLLISLIKTVEQKPNNQNLCKD